MKHIVLKIACIVIAILVWIQVAATTMVEADVGLPLRVVNLGEGLTLTGNNLPDVSRVRLRASKLSVMMHQYLGVPLGRVDIDLGGKTPGPSALFELKEADVRTGAEVVTLLPPVRLPLRLDWQDTRRLPVKVPVRGTLPADRLLGGPVAAVPESVTVTGPRRYFTGVDSLQTAVVELGSLDRTVTRDLALTPPPAPLVSATSTVSVTVPVVTVSERVVGNVPVIALVESHLGEAGVSPPVCDVLVRGPADSVAALSASRLTVTVPVGGDRTGTFEVAGQVQYPDWVLAVELRPPVFMVLLAEPAGEKRR